MEKLNFTKMVGAGNDFVVIDRRLQTKDRKWSEVARVLCHRKTGIGADGALVLEKSKIADFRMRIFNADGSEAEMCGNGLRCAVLFLGNKRKVRVETKAGIYEGEITAKDRVKVKMQAPKDLRAGFPINVDGRAIKVSYINTGVPHVVVFVEGLDKIDVDTIGSRIRYHDEFKPKGANVDFVDVIDSENIKMRTYERGVEGETLACGTGSVASAIITVLGVKCKALSGKFGINVHTRGGILKIEFQKIDNKIKNVYLEGEVRIVFQGGIYV